MKLATFPKLSGVHQQHMVAHQELSKLAIVVQNFKNEEIVEHLSGYSQWWAGNKLCMSRTGWNLRVDGIHSAANQLCLHHGLIFMTSSWLPLANRKWMWEKGK